MDKIQKFLVKHGRVDLAQNYYEKFIKLKNTNSVSNIKKALATFEDSLLESELMKDTTKQINSPTEYFADLRNKFFPLGEQETTKNVYNSYDESAEEVNRIMHNKNKPVYILRAGKQFATSGAWDFVNKLLNKGKTIKDNIKLYTTDKGVKILLYYAIGYVKNYLGEEKLKRHSSPQIFIQIK